jgi:hypothetical protein
MSTAMAPPDAAVTRLGKLVTPEPVKSAVKGALRGFGLATAPLRGRPAFLIIGAKRCGSTSMYRWLLRHPQVAPLFPALQHIKGVHWFDRHPDRPMSWYRSFYPIQLPFRPRAAGEASPYYLIHPLAAERAAAAVGDAKVLVLLREPAARAYSHWRDEVRLGNETLSFADALAAEPARVEPELARMEREPGYYSWIHEHLTYRTWGCYAQHLARWLTFWPSDQIMVACTEEVYRPGSPLPREITDFLGLGPHPDRELPWFNASKPPDPDDAEIFSELRSSYAADNAALGNIFPAVRIPWT